MPKLPLSLPLWSTKAISYIINNFSLNFTNYNNNIIQQKWISTIWQNLHVLTTCNNFQSPCSTSPVQQKPVHHQHQTRHLHANSKPPINTTFFLLQQATIKSNPTSSNTMDKLQVTLFAFLLLVVSSYAVRTITVQIDEVLLTPNIYIIFKYHNLFIYFYYICD